MEVRLMTFMESRIHGDMYVRFGGGFLETCYSNIVRRWVSILRLKAQYIWYLGAGILALLILFAILYIAGINQYICLAIILGGGSALVYKVYGMSNTYGEHGMMKMLASRSIPKVIKSNNRGIFISLAKTRAK